MRRLKTGVTGMLYQLKNKIKITKNEITEKPPSFISPVCNFIQLPKKHGR